METNDVNSLALAFSDSLVEDTIDCIGEYAELGLDGILDEGLLKDIPVVSTAVAIYKIGSSIRDRHNLKKLVTFLDEINKGIVDDRQRLAYQNKFRTGEGFRNEQLEYLMVLIDRYTNYDKPRLLAKLFMAYLDGSILWEELLMYAEVIDRFLLLDCNLLTSDSSEFIVHRNIGVESVLRLVALGLMVDVTNMSPFEKRSNGNIGMTWETLQKFQTADRTYRRTEFGTKLADILG